VPSCNRKGCAAMVSSVSTAVSAPCQPADDGRHWLHGRYFVPIPDLSDETRLAINAGRAGGLWLEIVTRLRDLERRGSDKQAKGSAYVGRLVGLGVNGLAAAVGCSHTTVLKHLRHLEGLGLIRTEQATYTVDRDAETGRVRRNYAKAPPKVIVVTVEDRHCRPTKASGTRRTGTPEPGLSVAGGTPETGGNSSESQARNWRVSKDGNLQRGSHPLDGNGRRTDAGPLERPATAAAQTKTGQQPSMPAAAPPPRPPRTGPNAPVRPPRTGLDAPAPPLASWSADEMASLRRARERLEVEQRDRLEAEQRWRERSSQYVTPSQPDRQGQAEPNRKRESSFDHDQAKAETLAALGSLRG